MIKRFLALFLALIITLSLAAPASAAKIGVSNMPEYAILTELPATLDRPARPTTLEQADLYGHPARGGIFVEWSDESTLREITELTDSLTAGKTTDTQKMKAIFDWVYQNIKYDYDATLLWARWSELTAEQRRRVNEAAEVFHVYTNRRGICEGYSNLCWLMGTIAGIPVAKLTCHTRTAHARNAALLDGKWVFFDATEAWNSVDPDYSWDLDPYDRASSYSALDFYDGIYQVYGYRGDDANIVSAALRPGMQCPASVTIPSYATEVARSAFKGCTGLKSVTIPDGVTKIDGNAFEGCSNLERVTIPNSVTEIGGMAFRDCANLKQVNIPSSVTEIENYLFYGCASLESVNIPNGVTRIWPYAFAECTALKSITIPDSVTNIGQAAFLNCTGLESVTVGSGITKEDADRVLAFEGCINLKSITFANGGTGTGTDMFFTIENGVLTKYNGYGGAVTIPEGVTEIGLSAFIYCENLTSVTFPKSLKKIGDCAFSNCTGLTSLHIPDNVTEIGGSAFDHCTSLKSVTIPASISELKGFGQFNGCTGLESVTISDGVTKLGSVFGFCTGLKSVTVPGSVKELNGTFYNCTNLTDVTLEEGLTLLGGTFQDCTSLKNVVIPNGVTEISNVTFSGCTSLESVTIPASVTDIKRVAFDKCPSLTDIYYGGTEAQWKAVKISKDCNDALFSATIHYNSTAPDATTTPFSDVAAGKWYTDAVTWANERNITNGTGNGKFSPAENCTHAQILTFLYRAAQNQGKAEAADMDKAVAWAREKGMIDAGFNGGKPCTRAEAVNYIWQALGKKDAKASSFTDVPANASYAKAVDWAVANGVTNGDNAAQTEFSPDKVCTRGHIVTFLHRAYVPSARLPV